MQKHYDPDVLKSSYKSTYTKPAQNVFPDQIDSISQHFNNKPKNVPFYSDTSYKQSYPKYDVQFIFIKGQTWETAYLSVQTQRHKILRIK